MGIAINTLLGYQSQPDRFDIPWAEHADLRIAALDEAFQDRKDKIKLLAHRAEAAGIEQVTQLEDVVPGIPKCRAGNRYTSRRGLSRCCSTRTAIRCC